MAKRTKKPIVQLIALPESAAEPDTGVSAALVPDSRRLLTVAVDSALWAANLATEHLACEGAIVRLRPPAGATDELVAAMSAMLRRGGAAALRVEAAQALGPVVSAAAGARVAEQPSLTPRAAVLARLAAARTQDRTALVSLVSATMTKVGL